VGGIKEKLLAAQAAGMARALVPARNMPDVQVGAAGCLPERYLQLHLRLRLTCQQCSSLGGGVHQLHADCIALCCVALLQADVPAEVRLALQVVPCQRLEDVLQAAFDPPITLQQQQSLLARL
jgi:hypothetical protein